MKKAMSLIGAVSLILLLATACTSTPKVSRIDAQEQLDLSGNWNDTDIQLVTESLIRSCLSTGWADDFYRANRRNPVIVIGTIANNSSEHIDTSIISKKVEIALLSSGKADTVADIAKRDDVRKEREEQQYYASVDTAAQLAQETGADFLMQGSIKTNVDQVGGKAVRTYYVDLELIDITTSRKIWLDEDTVKKYIEKSRYRF
ncbi:MAG: penicillin-binding protein activator LpoB [Sphaerochaetaceae bacterium]